MPISPFPPSSTVPGVCPGQKVRDAITPGLYTNNFLLTVPPHSLAGVMWETQGKGVRLLTISQSPVVKSNMEKRNKRHF